MKQRLFYFLCTVLLSTETGWCSTQNKIDFSGNRFRYTISPNNWPTLNKDVELIEKKNK